MTDIIAKLSNQAMDYATEQYGLQRAGEKVWDPLTYDRKFAQLLVEECGVALSPMLRDMVSRGQAHELIKRHFNMMAGADIMGGDGGYREVSLKTPEFLEFQARWNALYGDKSDN